MIQRDPMIQRSFYSFYSPLRRNRTAVSGERSSWPTNRLTGLLMYRTFCEAQQSKNQHSPDSPDECDIDDEWIRYHDLFFFLNESSAHQMKTNEASFVFKHTAPADGPTMKLLFRLEAKSSNSNFLKNLKLTEQL